MTFIAENKAVKRSFGARRSSAGASIPKPDPSTKVESVKSEVVKSGPKNLFEGRLGLMSSLRKGLIR